MIKEKDWFKEAENTGQFIITQGVDRWTIYKGFKLTKHPDDKYTLQDVRFNDFYSEVRAKELEIIRSLGFIRGVDEISYTRNKRRVKRYTRKIERLYEDQKIYKHKIRDKERLEFYEKKLRNCNKNINRNIDNLFLYKSRVKNHESKYNKNDKH